MAKTILFRCTLRGPAPNIWRQFKVRDDYRMDRFHQVIQIAMGWKNAHLHEFIFENRRVGLLIQDGFDLDDVENENEFYLRDFNLKKGDRFGYLYDFGDDWSHVLEVEDITDENLVVPICVDGERACPPEDCGGIFGYMDLLETLKNPEDPEYDDLVEWLGEPLKPEVFPKKAVNAELKRFGQYHNAHPDDISTPWHQVGPPPGSGQGMNDDPIQQIHESMMAVVGAGNVQARLEMDGLSPMDMHRILYQAFEPSSPVGFRASIPAEVLEKIPLLNLVLAFLNRLKDIGELRLTAKGNLPRKLVLELYDLGHIKQYGVDEGIFKINKEADAIYIHQTRLLCDLSGFIKKRKNKISLTAKGKKLLNHPDKSDLLKSLFISNIHKFNLGYFDGYPESTGLQVTFGYTLYLLLKYGKEERNVSFYADKNIKAFPHLLQDFQHHWLTQEETYASSYKIRIFERLLVLYGLVDFREEGQYSNRQAFTKTSDWFDAVFEIRKELLVRTQHPSDN